jgi:hypothetical protein
MGMCGANIGVPRDWPIRTGSSCSSSVCSNLAIDYLIKRHDTKPPFKVKVEDCNGPMDLSDPTMVLEANIWFKTKLKDNIDTTNSYFRFLDNIGFDQILMGDIIVMNRARNPEHMLVVAFDEENHLVQVNRGYNGTTASSWKKGQEILVFRAMNAPASIETVYDDITQMDGTILPNQLIETFLVYDFSENCTCMPGCYLIEFKLLKMVPPDTSGIGILSDSTPLESIIPTFTPAWPQIPSNVPSTFVNTYYNCGMGTGVEWVRRFPNNKEGFVIQVFDSPTAELQ